MVKKQKYTGLPMDRHSKHSEGESFNGLSVSAQRGDHEGAIELMREYNLRSQDRRSTRWPVLLAAKDLLRTGRRDEGLVVLRRLAADGYQPAERMLMEEDETYW